MTYHDRVERAVTVYLNLRRNGINKSEALRVTSICTDVPLRSLRRWRDCSLEDGVIHEDRRGTTITGKKRWMLALIDGMEEDLSRKTLPNPQGKATAVSAVQAERLTLSNRLTDHILFNETLQRRNGLLKRS
jgi:hypothetical protein